MSGPVTGPLIHMAFRAVQEVTSHKARDQDGSFSELNLAPLMLHIVGVDHFMWFWA